MKLRLTGRQLLVFGVPILGLLLGLLGYVLLVAPQKSEAKKLASEITAAQSQVLAAHRKPAERAPVDVRAADLFRLTKAMPDSSDVPGVLRQLARAAAASSVTLQSVKPSPLVPLALGYGALPVAITVTGKFAEVSDFLQFLRQQVSIGPQGRLRVDGRLLVANQVQLTSSDGRSVSATLNLDAFVYGVAAPAAAVGPTGASGAARTTTTGSAR